MNFGGIVDRILWGLIDGRWCSVVDEVELSDESYSLCQSSKEEQVYEQPARRSASS